jgi:thiazole/oxazole-forming peptide maturase SagD family component
VRPDPSWLLAAAPRGIVAVRGTTEAVLALEAPFDALVAVLDALRAGGDPERVASAAGTSVADAQRAVATLTDLGVFAAEAGPLAPGPEGVPLTEAILSALADRPVTVAWTADEVLVVPPGPGPRVTRRAVRAFVAGLAPDARAEAYAAVAAIGLPSATGDRPEPAAVDRAVAAARGAAPDHVHAISLADGRRRSVAPADLEHLGMDAPHRLGPLQDVRATATQPPLAGRRETAVAEYAVGNLASPWPRAFRIGRGMAPEASRAALIARAEAAERFGAYEVDPARLRDAPAGELDAPALKPDRLQRFAARQYAAHPDLTHYREGDRILWMRGATPRGEARWVPAEAVHVGLRAPGRRGAFESSSSGLAAGATARDAADAALREAIERDAFMWTWVQRASRERLDPAGLDAGAAGLAHAIEAMGYGVSLVNITLDTKPVVMAVLHNDERIHVAAACRESAAQAAAKALDETALVLSLEHPHAPPDVRAEDVETPEDHMWLHLHREAARSAAFLWASDDVIAMDEVASAPGPVAEVVTAVGEPVLVDLTSPRTAPFHVVRALVPGLVPISFGYDREALGMERLARPARTAAGRRLGRDLPGLGERPILPHPFP